MLTLPRRLLFALPWILAGCTPEPGPDAAAEAATAPASAGGMVPSPAGLPDTPRPAAGDALMPPFVDVTAASGIAYRVGFTLPSLLLEREEREVSIATNGGGAAGDCDNDSDIDLFITYGNTGGPDGGGGPNRLYINQLAETGQPLTFVDQAAAAGVANSRPGGRNNDRHSGPAFADMDGDGDLDLFVGGIFNDPSKIYENQGDCTFVDVTANSPGIVDMLAMQTISAGFGDYDLDGDLDMFLSHWGSRDEVYGIYGDLRIIETEHLWRNDSDADGIRFVNVSEASGMAKLTWQTREHLTVYGQEQFADFTFTPTFARLNNDLWPDIAIAADFGTTQLALNNGDGTFSALRNPALGHVQFGMGSALADLDHDGDLDWLVTSIFGPGETVSGHGNKLFINEGGPHLLADGTAHYGVADGAFGWGACFLDIDNNSDLDIYHTNGWPERFLSAEDTFDTDRSRVFYREGAGYSEQAAAFGLAAVTAGRGAICADFDHDGDIDILELTADAPNSARLWENRSAARGHQFLRIRLRGAAPNTQASGARIFVTTGEKRQMREIMIGGSYLSQQPAVQVFGLGTAEVVDEILIEWPAVASAAEPEQLGTLLEGPIAASRPGQTLVIAHPDLEQP